MSPGGEDAALSLLSGQRLERALTLSVLWLCLWVRHRTWIGARSACRAHSWVLWNNPLTRAVLCRSLLSGTLGGCSGMGRAGLRSMYHTIPTGHGFSESRSTVHILLLGLRCVMCIRPKHKQCDMCGCIIGEVSEVQAPLCLTTCLMFSRRIVHRS